MDGVVPYHAITISFVSCAPQPGNGAGYVKHLDFDGSRRAKDVASTAPQESTVTGRKLTVIVYLNEQWEGGQLRVHQSDGGKVDVDPSLGRIVLFRRYRY